MQDVTVDRDRLLSTVRENRAKHEQDFEDALFQYHFAQKVEVQEWMDMLEAGEDFNCVSKLIRPQAHLEEYDTAIQMLEFSIEPKIVLEEHEFQQLVMDKWHWKAAYNTAKFSTTTYLSQQH